MESALLGAGGKDKGSPATGSNGCGGEGIFHAHMPPHGGGMESARLRLCPQDCLTFVLTTG